MDAYKLNQELAPNGRSNILRAYAFAALLLLSLLGASLVLANQTPSSSAGAGPVTKTYPGGLTMQISEVGTPTSFFAPSANLNATGGITAAMVSPAISLTTNASDMDVASSGCVTTTFRCSRGTLTLTFSQAVTNPVIHISGIGAAGGGAFFHTSFTMSSSDAPSLPTFTRLAGNTPFTVSATEIRSSAINGGTNCTAATPAACGSVRINGTFTTVTMQLDLLMGGSGTPTGQDGWTITASVDEDFGDAPGSYDTTAAASHIVGGYFMGTAPTVENAGVTNVLATPVTPSPIANATASTDGSDNGVTFPTLVRSVASTIDVAVTGSGGRLQGWIDWADDGNFTTAGDQIATNAIDGGAGDTDGLVNGVIRLAVTPPAGTTQVTTISRFRWSAIAGVGPTTRGSVGEVEDYEVIVYPQRADLSLTKAVSNASPSNGSTVSYTLTVASAASPASTATATGITVQDTLPAGFSYVSQSGSGTYNSGTGLWTIGSLAPGTSAAITLTGTVTATSGTVINAAEIRASSLPDPDSTPNNGSSTEDDYQTATFTVASVLPALVCPAGGTNQIIANGTFATGTGPSWTSWTAGAVWTGSGLASVNNDTTSGTLSQSGLSGLKFGPNGSGGAVIQLSQWWRNGGPAASSTSATLTVSLGGTNYAVVTTPAGAGTSATVTYLNGATGNLTSLTEFASTGWRINIPTTVNATGALSFAFAPGGTAPSDDFEVDNVTLYTCTPGQLSATKISSVVSDGVSISNPKAIPNATVQYCIVVTNTGTVTNGDVLATDNLPANVEFVPGSMRTGSTCGSASQSEDENNTDPDESNPFGMSFAAGGTFGTGIVTGTASSLAPSASVAFVFNVEVN